ncbi:hypothetical protein ACFPOI_21940 [Nonomuraea angiospora]|uniref:Flagellar motor protein MotB n=1 Tax=Nonomuraea angiospora TaxID=46172 RepID=A0ABR9MK81_9ACTN|nr:hypothetical protein [Nonomuraea angiospora]MBE1593330.1 flagellar motor protein MotB [Nonomuraea angiospora]
MSDTLRAQLTVNRARSAARAGDLATATRLLEALDVPDTADTVSTAGDAAVAVLDLRARLHAQRGELAKADQCWAAVQALSPDDPGAAAGRRTIEAINAGRRRKRPLVHTGWLGVAAAAVAAVVLTAGIVVLVPGGQATRPGGGEAAATSATGEASGAEEARRRLAALEAERAAAGERRAAAEARRAEETARRKREVAAIARRLTMPGVLVHRHPQYVRVRFGTGLFPVDDKVSVAGAELLKGLGRRMAGMDAEITVVGHAVAVPGGRARDGSVLALARAVVAAAHLAEGGDLPRTSFKLVSGDQRAQPFRDDRRNRTVTLLIAPRP